MSRIGKQPVKVPETVEIKIADGVINVVGARGALSQIILPHISLKADNGSIEVERANNSKTARSNHGLMRALVQNMVKGVSDGYSKQLEINGVGYRVAANGAELNFSLGYSHPIKYKLPDTVTANIEQNQITVAGHDKQLVGQVAADIRSLRKPEPYKGKGIKYSGERLIRKSGKSGKEK